MQVRQLVVRMGIIRGCSYGGILSPLLANVALSELDEHFARAWQAMDTTGNQRLRRRATGLATYRLVRFADLCRGRHKSA
jgi:RNA-directed DNA polymerase